MRRAAHVCREGDVMGLGKMGTIYPKYMGRSKDIRDDRSGVLSFMCRIMEVLRLTNLINIKGTFHEGRTMETEYQHPGKTRALHMQKQIRQSEISFSA